MVVAHVVRDHVHAVGQVQVRVAAEAVLGERLERPRRIVAEPAVDSYTAAKGGIIALTRAMALNYAKHGVRVNTISPGYVITECQMGWYADPKARAAAEATHLTRLGQPGDIAELALFLASDKAAFITGSNIVIDGGFTAFKTQAQGGDFFRKE